MDEGPLRLVREYVNTHDLETGTDDLPGPDDLRKWLCRNDLLRANETVTEADLSRAIALREAVRELLHHCPGHGAAAATLNTVARRGKLHPEFGPTGTVRLVPAAMGADRALGTLLVTIIEAMADGRWRRLKVCRNDACRWAFFDTSRAGAGKWCSMAVCGNRNKAAAWRTRQRERTFGVPRRKSAT